MIWSISWRNVWRNKMRSLVVISAIAIGMFAGVFTTSFMQGWISQRMFDIVKTELAPIQIHKKAFRDNYEMSVNISNADSIIKVLSSNPEIAGATKRIIINSMVASPQTGTGARIIGVIPETEMKVSNIYENLVEGEYLKGVKRNPVVIGEKLAKKLGVGLRKKFKITIQDINGNLTSGAFRVSGIYRTNNTSFDESTIFVNYSDLLSLAALPENCAHEIAIFPSDLKKTDEITNLVSAVVPALETLNWKTLSPEMSMMDGMMQQYMYIIILIILLALCFGIINTMLMVVLERRKELGMLMAIGMNRVKVFWMIILETVFLTLTGGIAGIVAGYIFTYYLGNVGIDLSFLAEELRDFGYSPIIYPEIYTENLIVISILVLITGVLSAIYPARKAIKLNPAESISTD